MSTAEQIIAEHAASCYMECGNVICWCGTRFPGIRAHAAHVVAALANAGTAIVELPKPDSVDETNGFTAWELPQVNTVTAFTDGEIAIDGHIGGLTIAEARDVATRLLAAARVADGGDL